MWGMKVEACIGVKCKWNEAYVQGVLTYIHTLTLEWMNEAHFSPKREFLGEHSLWVYM